MIKYEYRNMYFQLTHQYFCASIFFKNNKQGKEKIESTDFKIKCLCSG